MKHNFKRLLSLGLCFALITAMALTMTSCDNTTTPTEPSSSGEAQTQSFTFSVTFADGTTKTETYEYEGEVNLGDFLQDKGVIAGDESEYGLYVKTVMGQTLDYDTDGFYWSLYVGEEMASTGVDGITVENGASYSFKAAK